MFNIYKIWCKKNKRYYFPEPENADTKC